MLASVDEGVFMARQDHEDRQSYHLDGRWLTRWQDKVFLRPCVLTVLSHGNQRTNPGRVKLERSATPHRIPLMIGGCGYCH